MKALTLSLAGLLLLAGCETKVINQPPSTGQPTVIDHPVVVPQDQQPQQPAVQNNIHVNQPQ